ncbi:MAG TPA: hypothetical protein VGF13_21240 [Verrucomicrobiae bacterium]
MSWIQWRGETWPVTDGTADLRLYLSAPDVGGPRQSWCIDLMQCAETFDPVTGEPTSERWLSIEAGHLPFTESDWRRWSGVEIRADGAWHDRHEHFNECGHHEMAFVEALFFQEIIPDQKQDPEGRVRWRAHDFIVRLGTREGLSFPCEIDAWMIPEKEYDRTQPETAEEVARFGEGPPNLRVITKAVFTQATVSLPRCGNDPIPMARRCLRDEIACEELFSPKLEWALRHTADGKEIVPMPGWRSTVCFATSSSKASPAPSGG